MDVNNISRPETSPYPTDPTGTEIFNTSEVNETHTNTSEFVDGCRVVNREFSYLPWDHADNIISLEGQFQTYKIMGVLIACLCLTGVPVNIINCIVYFKLGLRDRINFLLFCLGFADFVFTLYMLFVTGEFSYLFFIGEFKINGPLITAMTNHAVTILFGANYVSGSITTLIACERCLCITHPFKAKKILKTGTTAIIVSVSAIVLVGFHYFISEKFKISCEYIPLLRTIITAYYPSEFYKNNTLFVDILNMIVYGIFLPSFFILTTTVTTTICVIKLKRASQWRQGTTKGTLDSKEIALTKMLIALSILFIICAIPNVVVKVAPLLVPDFRIGGRYQNFMMMSVAVLYGFAGVNSTLNFFFYCKMGSRFRTTLKGLCGC